jgi:hypothetical protein
MPESVLDALFSVGVGGACSFILSACLASEECTSDGCGVLLFSGIAAGISVGTSAT